MDPLLLMTPIEAISPTAMAFGFRTGEIGTHTSRTIMLDEVTTLFSACPRVATRPEYREAVMQHNCLGKRALRHRPTAAGESGRVS